MCLFSVIGLFMSFPSVVYAVLCVRDEADDYAKRNCSGKQLSSSFQEGSFNNLPCSHGTSLYCSDSTLFTHIVADSCWKLFLRKPGLLIWCQRGCQRRAHPVTVAAHDQSKHVYRSQQQATANGRDPWTGWTRGDSCVH